MFVVTVGELWYQDWSQARPYFRTVFYDKVRPGPGSGFRVLGDHQSHGGSLEVSPNKPYGAVSEVDVPEQQL